MARWAALPVLLLLVAAVACRRAAPPAASPLRMQLATRPAVPAVGRDTAFTLRLSDPQGRPVAGASAKLSLEMTFMNMGADVVQLGDRGGGVYAGVGSFPMGGDWDVRATVRAGGRAAERVFHYKVGG